jgi:hypothetical protein
MQQGGGQLYKTLNYFLTTRFVDKISKIRDYVWSTFSLAIVQQSFFHGQPQAFI